MPFTLRLMFSPDFVKDFRIDRLPVDRLTCGFEFFNYRLDHLPLQFLLLRYALLPFAESAQIMIKSHHKPPVVLHYGGEGETQVHLRR